MTCIAGNGMRQKTSEFVTVSVTIPKLYKDVFVKRIFPLTASLWNYQPMECFPLAYNLNDFKSRIIRHFLSLCSF